MPKKTKIFLVLTIMITTAVIGIHLLLRKPILSSAPKTEHISLSDTSTADVNGKTNSTDDKAYTNKVKTKTPQVSEDYQMQQVIDQTVDSVSQKGVSLLDNPVHPGRAKLQKQMKQETLEETFSRLADNDSLMMLGPIMGAQFFAAGLYPSDVTVMCKMTCIRKLLADARSRPEEAASFLLDQLQIMGKDFPRVRTEFWQRWKESSVNGLMEISEWPDSEKYKLKSTAAVYVLSEINASKSLPALAWISTQGKPKEDDPEVAGTCLVNRKFVFYAMHKLVSQFPEAILSNEAASVRERYLIKAADKNITETSQHKVASWDAYYHEDDFRRTLPRKKLYMAGQPSIELSRFPSLRHLTTQDIEDLFVDLREFTLLAFPNSKIAE